jgi:hypothetical protein
MSIGDANFSKTSNCIKEVITEQSDDRQQSAKSGRPQSSLRCSLKAGHQCVNPTEADFAVLAAATRCSNNSPILGHPHTDPNSDRADS